MILDYCLSRRDRLAASMDRESMRQNEALLSAEGAPLGVDASELHAVLSSGLLEAAAAGERRCRRLEAIRRPNAAEYARLISKGRVLYEHCMAELSHVCVIGFMHHELTKSRRAEQVILDLLGGMVMEQVESEERGDDDAESRRAHTDYILDHGVSFLHGCSREEASRLAEDKEPLD